MKKSIVAIAILGFLMIPLFLTSTSQAKTGHYDKRMDPDKKISKLTKKLALSPDQADTIRQLEKEKHEKMEALMDQMHSLHDEYHEKIVKVLNAEQKEKFEKMMEKHHKRKHKNRHYKDR
jgi:Spy/CpxP family protein refolding chaperone